MRPDRHRPHSDLPAVPAILSTWLTVLRPCFTAPVWTRVLVLVAGAVLSPGGRTVTQALRVMGLAGEPGFGRYHDVLSSTFRISGCAAQGVDPTVEEVGVDFDMVSAGRGRG